MVLNMDNSPNFCLCKLYSHVSYWKISIHIALSVKSFLVQKGIDSKRIKCVGYGEQQPIADNSTEFGREKNRRIEIRILK